MYRREMMSLNRIMNIPRNGGGNTLLLKMLSKYIRIIYACDIPLAKCQIGSNAFFAHNGLGVVISREAKIGNGCKIYQNVTIGAGHGGYPTIGDNVTIYANSVVAGGVKIGDGAVIGACSYVNCDVPDGATFGGVPAKEIAK